MLVRTGYTLQVESGMAHVESLMFSLASHNLHRKQSLRLCLTLVHAKRSMFAHSIFDGCFSKEGFHGTHGTPSGSASAYASAGLYGLGTFSAIVGPEMVSEAIPGHLIFRFP